MKAPSKFNSIRSFFRPALVAGSVMLAMAAAAPTHARAESSQQQITVQIVDPGGNPVAVQSAYILPPEPRAPIATGLDPVELPPNDGAYTLRIVVAAPPPALGIPEPIGLPHAVYALQIVAGVRR